MAACAGGYVTSTTRCAPTSEETRHGGHRRADGQADTLDNSYDLDRLLSRLSSAQVVLIGEASHGTSEFYRWRAELTKRLIAEQGFGFVAVEGNWPDCHRLHCCVRGAAGAPNDPAAVLWGFRRWPRWMWGNEEIAEFAQWLRDFNTSDTPRAVGPGHPVGFHGLDVYRLWDSLDAVIGYLREHRPEHVDTALTAVRCFEPYREDPAAYAYATRLVPEDCEAEVVWLLSALAEQGSRSAAGLGEEFVARQNAEVVAGAERYYREMVRGGPESWNVRDRHMMATLHRLFQAYPSGAKGRGVGAQHACRRRCTGPCPARTRCGCSATWPTTTGPVWDHRAIGVVYHPRWRRCTRSNRPAARRRPTPSACERTREETS